MRTTRGNILAALLIGAIGLSSVAQARNVAGLNLPEQVQVAGRDLSLNGAAVQKLFIFKVYAVGLYLENKTADAREAIRSDEAKRIHLHVMHNASKSQISDALVNGMRKSGADMDALAERVEELKRQIPDVRGGEDLVITYVPGVGTELRGRGIQVTVRGKDFADALFGTWLGADPGVRRVREGLLGH